MVTRIEDLRPTSRRAGEEWRLWDSMSDHAWHRTQVIIAETGLGVHTVHRRLTSMLRGGWPVEKRHVGYWVEWRRVDVAKTAEDLARAVKEIEWLRELVERVAPWRDVEEMRARMEKP